MYPPKYTISLKQIQTILPFFIFFFHLCFCRQLCNPNDKKALLSIKQSFNNAYTFASWTPDTDCCRWYMVKCDLHNHRISSLSIFQSTDVVGQIPPAIADLRFLKDLTFQKLPNLIGPIPDFISKLPNLSFLWLSWTNLSGPIPDFLGGMKKLTYLNLSFNNLTGSIPPSLSQLNNLGALFLDRNKLTGSIPNSFGLFKNNPDFYLRLSHNRLSGPIPESLAVVNFSVLDLSRNMLTGNAAFLFGKEKGVQELDLSRNHYLSFDLSKVALPQALTWLDLNHNMIYGGFPVGTAVQEWQMLNVSYNRMCGPIPTGGNMGRFDEYSFLHNKCLCGTPLPPCK